VPSLADRARFADALLNCTSRSDVGVGWLEKRFLPVFEKIAPSRCVELTVLLTPTTVHFIYDAKALGGAEIHADFLARGSRARSACRRTLRAVREPLGTCGGAARPLCLTRRSSQVAELFDPESYKLTSAHGNKARTAHRWVCLTGTVCAN
jgi:hypothetical protein